MKCRTRKIGKGRARVEEKGEMSVQGEKNLSIAAREKEINEQMNNHLKLSAVHYKTSK